MLVSSKHKHNTDSKVTSTVLNPWKPCSDTHCSIIISITEFPAPVPLETNTIHQNKSAKPYTNCQQMDGQGVIMDQQF